MVRNCPSLVRCREATCGRKHHTLLHVDQSEPEADRAKAVLNSAQLPTQFGKRTTFFQLVSIYATGNNGRTLPMVALLDSGSQLTLIHDSLAKDLGLKGERRPLSIKTMNSEVTRESSSVSLRIRSQDPALVQPLLVRKAWTVGADAFRCSAQCLSPSWDHCKGLGIPDCIEPSDVRMLIGVDYPEAHLQLEVRRGTASQPLAVCTKLGWTIMGADARSEAENSQLEARVNFIKAEDHALHDQLQKFWQTEAFGTKHDLTHPSSAEDRRAQQVLDDNTKLVDGHYRVPMLWRPGGKVLPKNRRMAQQRYDPLLKRFERDANFKELYIQTMNGYIDKGFARQLMTEEVQRTTPKAWYLPHFGVTSPHKPGKVWIVFDAAAPPFHSSLCMQELVITELHTYGFSWRHVYRCKIY